MEGYDSAPEDSEGFEGFDLDRWTSFDDTLFAVEAAITPDTVDSPDVDDDPYSDDNSETDAEAENIITSDTGEFLGFRQRFDGSSARNPRRRAEGGCNGFPGFRSGRSNDPPHP
ncbi:MAG TPA: hypothetical protein VFM05_00655, partial [Candidatus Saccharimonadales bacterium]|nr:hypothetical protein [Candidatus Saccharimonadales bacterium]